MPGSSFFKTFAAMQLWFSAALGLTALTILWG